MKEQPFIELPSFGGTEFINPEDICAIKVDDKHICLFFEEQDEKQIRLSIGSAVKKLDLPYFVRCHRSYIVNVLKIKGRCKNGLQLQLKNDLSIPVSKSYKKNIQTGAGKILQKTWSVKC
jgi:DNA-binding LytR/AlgR family response regulator